MRACTWASSLGALVEFAKFSEFIPAPPKGRFATPKEVTDVAEWVRKYPVQVVAYSARTASAVAARLAPAGIRVEPIDDEETRVTITGNFPTKLLKSFQERMTKNELSTTFELS